MCKKGISKNRIFISKTIFSPKSNLFPVKICFKFCNLARGTESDEPKSDESKSAESKSYKPDFGFGNSKMGSEQRLSSDSSGNIATCMATQTLLSHL